MVLEQGAPHECRQGYPSGRRPASAAETDHALWLLPHPSPADLHLDAFT
jgi:hypothetical protein